jgi:hypothetical protein
MVSTTTTTTTTTKPFIPKHSYSYFSDFWHKVMVSYYLFFLQISLFEECGMLDRALEEMQKKESKIVSPMLPYYIVCMW